MIEEAAAEDESGTIGRVKSWLDRTGYRLEMRTAAAFRAEGLVTESARHYVAEDGETLREIDVVATGWAKNEGGDRPQLEVAIVVECKAGRSQPWVAFLGDERFIHDEDVLATMRVDVFGGTPDAFGDTGKRLTAGMIRGLHGAPMLHSIDRLAYAVTETGDKTTHAYNAVRQVTSAVDGYARDRVEKTDRPTLRVTVPIVVTGAPLVTCRLDRSGSEVLEGVDRVLLVARLRPAATLLGCLDRPGQSSRGARGSRSPRPRSVVSRHDLTGRRATRAAFTTAPHQVPDRQRLGRSMDRSAEETCGMQPSCYPIV